MVTEEPQFTGTVGIAELLKEQPPEQPREYTHRQKEPRPAGDPTLAIERQSTAGHDPVHMGMMRHRRTPGM